MKLQSPIVSHFEEPKGYESLGQCYLELGFFTPIKTEFGNTGSFVRLVKKDVK